MSRAFATENRRIGQPKKGPVVQGILHRIIGDPYPEPDLDSIQTADRVIGRGNNAAR